VHFALVQQGPGEPHAGVARQPARK
jgi:hypothetical protein